ncbi:hypothetical protein [Escherichia coli]|uniref:hypothetical protein n=1 Tax=Escherichia coli TaxID=562 RepID=UPI001FF4BA26|nr:hypothetical protein [Escherichia coli]
MNAVEIKTNTIKETVANTLVGLKISSVSASRILKIKEIVDEVHVDESLIDEGFLDEVISSLEENPTSFLEGSEVREGVIYSLNTEEEYLQGAKAIKDYFAKIDEVEKTNVACFTNIVTSSLLDLEVVN